MSCNNNYKPPRTSGVHCQLPEVSSNAFNHNRISGVSGRLKNFDFISSKGEDKKAKKARQSILDNPLPSIQQLSQLFHHSGSFSCNNSFSVLTNGQKQGLEHLPRLLGNTQTQPTCKGRIDLVEGQFGSLEWESPSFRGTRGPFTRQTILTRHS